MHLEVSIKRNTRVLFQDRILHHCLQCHTQPHQEQGGGEVSGYPLPKLCGARIRPLSGEIKRHVYVELFMDLRFLGIVLNG